MEDNSLYHGIEGRAHDDRGVDRETPQTGHSEPLSGSGAPIISTVTDGYSRVMSAPQPVDVIIGGLQDPDPNLLEKAQRVDAIWAEHGKEARDPNDPKGRTYYGNAKNQLPASVPSVRAPEGTPRAGLAFRYHSGLYVGDLDCIPPGTPPGSESALVEGALASLAEHPYTVAYGHSPSGDAWVILAGPRAENALAHRHYLQVLLNGMPEPARRICSMTGQNNVGRLRYLYPDPQARYRPDWIRAELPPPTNRALFQVPGKVTRSRSSGAGESASRRQAEMQAALEENGVAPEPLTDEEMVLKRAEVQDALASIPLEDGTGYPDWITAGYALCAADYNWPGFGGRELFLAWTRSNSYRGSTKLDLAYDQYTHLERTRSTTLTIGPLYKLARAHGWRGPYGEDEENAGREKEVSTPGGKAGNPEASKTDESLHPEGSDVPSVSIPADRRHKVRLIPDEGSNIGACVAGIRASNHPPTLFAISEGRSVGTVTKVGHQIGMEFCSSPRTHLEISRRLRFTKVTEKNGERPGVPTVTLMNLVHHALPPELPPFNGFKRMPFLWDGALVTTPGYHAESGYYVDLPDGLDLTLPVPEALLIIDEFLGEFPFQGPVDKANAWSVILGFPLKALGNAPGLFVDKPASQTGASLLCQCLGAVIEGKEPLLVTQGKSIGEFDKRLVAALKNHPAALIFDNLNQLLDSDMAASGMTDASFGGRLLGGNDEIRIPTKSLTLMFTANNLTATRELQNRSIRCRLDANHARPETRTDFRHILPGAVLTNRTAIVSAVSSIVQRWIEMGSPQGSPVLGSFIEYTKAVSGLVEFVGLGPLDGNRMQMVTEVTPSWEALDTLILKWWGEHGDQPMRAIDLVKSAAELDLKGDDERSRATSLSRRLGKALGQVFDVEDGINVKLLESGRDERGRAKQGLRYRLLRL